MEASNLQFLKGKFVSIWDKKCEVWGNARDTLIRISDIMRVKACKINVHDPVTKKNTESRVGLVATAVNRVINSDDNANLYELTDPISTIAEAIGRSEEELSTMLLELEVKD